MHHTIVRNVDETVGCPKADVQPSERELQRCDRISDRQRGTNSEEEHWYLEEVAKVVRGCNILKHLRCDSGCRQGLRANMPRAHFSNARSVHPYSDNRDEHYLRNEGPENRVTHDHVIETAKTRPLAKRYGLGARAGSRSYLSSVFGPPNAMRVTGAPLEPRQAPSRYQLNVWVDSL